MGEGQGWAGLGLSVGLPLGLGLVGGVPTLAAADAPSSVTQAPRKPVGS